MTTPYAPRCADHRVEVASEGDADLLSQVIASAFSSLTVSEWLIPDPDKRAAIFPGYFRIYVEQALAAGLVLTTPPRDAVALWVPIGREGPSELPEKYHERLAAVTGQHLAQFEALDVAFQQHHPTGLAHEHLAILAVRPDRQRLGIGTILLSARHAILDLDWKPAYLEASDLDKRRFYQAHGYLDLGEPIQLPDGPLMYPMVRFPRPRTIATEERM